MLNHKHRTQNFYDIYYQISIFQLLKTLDDSFNNNFISS